MKGMQPPRRAPLDPDGSSGATRSSMPTPAETAQRIRRRLLPEARELRDALWLGSILFAITGSYTLVKIARDTLFLSVLPARMLPFVYLVVGVLTLGVSIAYGRLTQ